MDVWYSVHVHIAHKSGTQEERERLLHDRTSDFQHSSSLKENLHVFTTTGWPSKFGQYSKAQKLIKYRHPTPPNFSELFYHNRGLGLCSKAQKS